MCRHFGLTELEFFCHRASESASLSLESCQRELNQCISICRSSKTRHELWFSWLIFGFLVLVSQQPCLHSSQSEASLRRQDNCSFHRRCRWFGAQCHDARRRLERAALGSQTALRAANVGAKKQGSQINKNIAQFNHDLFLESTEFNLRSCACSS